MNRRAVAYMIMPTISHNRHRVCLRSAVFVPMKRTVTVLGVGLLFACAPSDIPATSVPDTTLTESVQRVALRTLFLERERAASIVLFADARTEGPVFAELGASHVQQVATPDALALHYITIAELEMLFADHVDGWAAFFRQYPRSAGLVEVSAVQLQPDGRSASLTVARSCGEHCRMAWRVVVVVPDTNSDEVPAAEPTVASITSLPAAAVGR